MDWERLHSEECALLEIGVSIRRRAAQTKHYKDMLPKILAAFEQYLQSGQGEAELNAGSQFKETLKKLPLDSNPAAVQIRSELSKWAEYFMRRRDVDLRQRDNARGQPRMEELVNPWYDGLEKFRAKFSVETEKKVIFNGFAKLFSLLASLSEAYRQKNEKKKAELRELLAKNPRMHPSAAFTTIYSVLDGIVLNWRRKATINPADAWEGHKAVDNVPWQFIRQWGDGSERVSRWK